MHGSPPEPFDSMALAALKLVLPAAVLVLGAALLPACDNSFEPTAAGGPPFSVFGYVDAAADTQWIRVNAVRDALVATAEPTGLSVTLENATTGRLIALRDTAVTFVSMLSGQRVYAHDFQTTERIEPGATYLFRVGDGAGSTAQSTLHVPRAFRLEEVWVIQPMPGVALRPRTPYLWVEGASHIPFRVESTWFDDDCRPAASADSTVRLGPDSAGSHLIPVKGPGRAITNTCGRRTTSWVEAQVVASEAAWPWDQDYSPYRVGARALPTNLTGGIGFLGAVLTSNRIPVEDCALPYPNGPYCKLRYDSTTASLHATLSGLYPGATLTIELLELDPPPGEPPRTRFALPDRAGGFRVGAVRPGGRHQLTVWSGPLCLLADTLRFTAGRQTEWSGAIPTNVTCSIQRP